MSRHTLLITFPYSPIKQYLAFSRHRESESKQVFDWIVLLFSEIYNESFYLSEMKSSADMSKMNLANNPLNYMSFYITSSWNLCCKLDHQGVLSRNIRLDLDKLQARLVYRRVHMCVTSSNAISFNRWSLHKLPSLYNRWHAPSAPAAEKKMSRKILLEWYWHLFNYRK